MRLTWHVLGLCYSLTDFCIGYHAYDVIPYCSHHVMYFPAHVVLGDEHLLVLIGDQTQRESCDIDEMSTCSIGCMIMPSTFILSAK
jgi:hypothetical protein